MPERQKELKPLIGQNAQNDQKDRNLQNGYKIAKESLGQKKVKDARMTRIAKMA